MSTRKKARRRWPLVLGVCVLAIALVGASFFAARSRATEESLPETCTIARGDVEATITGNGRLESADTLDVFLPEGVKIEEVLVEAGDGVKQGDALATLEQDSLQELAAQLSGELSALDAGLRTRRLESTIESPVRGRIKYLPAGEGDDVIEVVCQYGALAVLSTDGLMQVALETGSPLALHTEVSVKWSGGEETGTVAARTQDGYVVTLDDGNAPYRGRADVYLDDVYIGSGTMEIHAPLAVLGAGGTIGTVHYEEGDEVYAGTTLFTLDNEPAVDAYRQTMAERGETAERLRDVLQYQSAPYVYAETDGVVANVFVADGDRVPQDSAGESVAFTLHTGGAVKMRIDVDELDIGKVCVGQSAAVTLDAYADDIFSARVSRVSRLGEASGSITTYAVELLLDADDRLLEGMNGSAVILSESARDVPLMPLSAVYEDADGAYVYRLDGDGQQVRTPIQTGLSDGTNAQVLSGLQEGDTIVCGGETRENPGQAMGFAGMLERREALMGGETDA